MPSPLTALGVAVLSLLATMALAAAPDQAAPAKDKGTVFRPIPGRAGLEFRVPEKAAARFAALVAGPAEERTLAPGAPLPEPDGIFLIKGTAYYFHAEPGLLRHDLGGNKFQTWSGEALRRLGKDAPKNGRWTQEVFDQWIAGLEKVKEPPAPKQP